MCLRYFALEADKSHCVFLDNSILTSCPLLCHPLVTHANNLKHRSKRMNGSVSKVAQLSDDSNPWAIFEDPDRRIEISIPSHWITHESAGVLVDLHAPHDAWTVILLSSHATRGLRFGELVNELISDDETRWTLQRRASVIHNGCGAIEVDFGLSSNGASWLMRKTFLPIGEVVFVFSFMTRLATWSRYSSLYRDVHRSFGPAHPGQRQSALPRSAPKSLPPKSVGEQSLII